MYTYKVKKVTLLLHGNFLATFMLCMYGEAYMSIDESLFVMVVVSR